MCSTGEHDGVIYRQYTVDTDHMAPVAVISLAPAVATVAV